ncbi:MAG: SoxR reducing system RseC family protein [Spirochaetia bacterium]|jgi:sigma-E factor negative regulatory protein RseC|nr:SoxR reducing system RseC family protein [Spirochaetia bacterium]
MKEQGIATKIDGQTVTVRIGSIGSCAHCGSQHDCSIVGKELEGIAASDQDIGLGDVVELTVGDSARAAGALWLLAVPLLLFFLGYLGAGSLWPQSGEGIQALLGLSGLALGLLFAATVARRGRMSTRPQVTLVAKAGPILL